MALFQPENASKAFGSRASCRPTGELTALLQIPQLDLRDRGIGKGKVGGRQEGRQQGRERDRRDRGRMEIGKRGQGGKGRVGKEIRKGKKGGTGGRERWRKVRHAENLAPTAIYKSRRLYMSTAASITVCVCLRERNNAY